MTTLIQEFPRRRSLATWKKKNVRLFLLGTSLVISGGILTFYGALKDVPGPGLWASKGIWMVIGILGLFVGALLAAENKPPTQK